MKPEMPDNMNNDEITEHLIKLEPSEIRHIRIRSMIGNPYAPECPNRHLWSEGYRAGAKAEMNLAPTDQIHIQIRPLSVNEAWKGKRYRTPKYRQYQNDLGYLLPAMKIPQGKLEVWLTFGFSNDQSDDDNPIKPTIDIMATKYGFNDKQVYQYHVRKEIVPKGKEYIKFKIEPLKPTNQ
jgi:Holliday junction resolvase RusA-like endonuclease